MSKQSYWEKLRDPRWQRLRLEVMNRDNFTCRNCDDTTSTLNVHHLQYHGDPWESPLDELETLCEACHKKRTDLNKFYMGLKTKTALFIRECATKWITQQAAIAAQPKPRKRLLTQEEMDEKIKQARANDLLQVAPGGDEDVF